MLLPNSSGSSPNSSGSSPNSSESSPKPSICWFRRDLRLSDHPALAAAAEEGPVVGVFVIDPRFWSVAGDNRRAVLVDCLSELVAASEGGFVVRSGDPAEVIPALAREVGATRVHVTPDFAPLGRRRDSQVAKALDEVGVELRWAGSNHLVAPGNIFTQSDTPYKVFTPYYRVWETLDHDAPTGAVEPEWHRGLSSDGPPERPDVADTIPAGGEQAAWDRADQFFDEVVENYHETRDRPDLAGTSRLSVDLKFGTIHPRQLVDRCGDGEGPTAFVRELAFRDFYADVLFHRPDTVWGPVVTSLADIEVDTGPDADAAFERWQEGTTGFPIVDAGMRQLSGEGWMHNRVRMIVASFLVKDLHLDWRRGAQHFLDLLIDADLASNQQGWQWVAGCGTDASPYHRVFNPISQSKKFDPDGDYIRRWVPELSDVSNDHVHQPAEAEGSLFDQVDYPAPMVDHASEREVALDRYEAAKETAS